MFDLPKCDVCGMCLEQCQFADFNSEYASKSFQTLIGDQGSPWVIQCITRFARNKYCEKGAWPFDLICQKQEESGQYLPKALMDVMHVQGDYSPPNGEGRAVSLVPMRLHALSPKCKETGLPPYFITDPCRMALGESVG